MNTPGNVSARGPLAIQADTRGGTLALTLSGRAHAEALDQVKAALDGLRAAPGRRLHLRLGDLDTCEPPVAWELLEFVRDVKDDGAEVVVESRPDPVVSTVLMLADVRDDLRLRTDGDGPRT